MMPLWTIAMRPDESTCGCALMSVGAPWVAQRVWPMPTRPARRFGSESARVAELAGATVHLHGSGGSDDRDARGVIAAVLDLAEPSHENRNARLTADVANDPTHETSSYP